MDKQVAIRSMRIAASVFFGVLAVVTLGCSFRSRHVLDSCLIPIWNTSVVPVGSANEYLHGVTIGSANGHLTLATGVHYFGSNPTILFRTVPIDKSDAIGPSSPSTFHFGGDGIMVPHWFAAMALAGLAALPWFPFSSRFSLLTMLVATTLVAVVLGLAVWVLK